MATLIGLQQQIDDLTRTVDTMRRDAVPQPVRRPVGGSGATGGLVEYGVVRDIGDGADSFVMVQKLKQIAASPKFEFPEVEGAQVSAVEIDAWPGQTSDIYAPFLSSASGAFSLAFIGKVIPILPGALKPIAMPFCPFDFVDATEILQAPQTDAFPATPA